MTSTRISMRTGPREPEAAYTSNEKGGTCAPPLPSQFLWASAAWAAAKRAIGTR